MRALLSVVLPFLMLCGPAWAQDTVHVTSLDGTVLPGYLYASSATGKSPALVLMHGCGGLFDRRGHVEERTTSWARRLTADGYTVLAIDSFSPRDVHGMCSHQDFRAAVYDARPADALGALRWLQARPDVAADRIGVMGWSEGGGAVLSTIRADNPARPATPPQGAFRAAVAFYPARCNRKAQGAVWRSGTPLLVLIGGGDVWTPAAPCKALIDTAHDDGAQAEIVVYPGAYHDFDWPGMPTHSVPAYRERNGIVPIEGYDSAAAADAARRVPDFLDHLLKP